MMASGMRRAQDGRASGNGLQATFVLHRFERRSPGAVEVIGRWTGIAVHELGDVVLVVADDAGLSRVAALPDSVGGTVNSWHVVFPWDGDPGLIEDARLEIGGSLVVQLPTQVPARRRMAGTKLRGRPGGEARAPPRPPVPDDPMVLHGALIATREELEELRERLEVAEADARRA